MPRDFESALEVSERYRASPFIQSVAAAAARPPILQQRLDAFRAAMTPTYHSPEGDVAVATPFAMSVRYAAQVPVLKKNTPAQDAAQRRAGLSAEATNAVLSGRGSPEDIRRFTQALIENGALSRDASKPLAERVRQMMFDHGVGIDCAGYVQRAYLYATGTSRVASGFRAPGNEDLSGLVAHGFTRVPSVAALQPGDVVSLGPPAPDDYGHRLIVYDQHAATAAEVDALEQQFPDKVPALVGTPSGDGPGESALYVITVDSSWGSGGHASEGGVDRRTLLYSAASKKWAWTGPATGGGLGMGTGDTPIAHPLIGFFRGPTHVAGASP
jgi:hypothetical protein